MLALWQACWSADGSKIYVGRSYKIGASGTGENSFLSNAFLQPKLDVVWIVATVDEYDFATEKLMRSLRMPGDSGPVSYVASMPNNNHIIW